MIVLALGFMIEYAQSRANFSETFMKNINDIEEKSKKFKKTKAGAGKTKAAKNVFKKIIKNKFGSEIKRGKFSPPEWWDCGWKRIPCGKVDCPICSREMARQVKNVMRGKEPDDLELVFEDMLSDLRELKEMIRKDAKRFGIEVDKIEIAEMSPLRELEEFPLYQEAYQWRKRVYELLDSLQFNNDLWMQTEEASNLVWYADTFLAKISRQLGIQSEKELGIDFLEVDYEYTKGVLKKCGGIIKNSLGSLYENKKFSRPDLNRLDREFLDIEKKALEV